MDGEPCSHKQNPYCDPGYDFVNRECVSIYTVTWLLVVVSAMKALVVKAMLTGILYRPEDEI